MKRVIPTRRALTEQQFASALEYLGASSSSPIRDELILTLAIMAGLRAHEIAGLAIASMTEADGRILETLSIDRALAKFGTPRVVEIKGRVREALIRFHTAFPDAQRLSDVLPEAPATAVREFLATTYAEIGYVETAPSLRPVDSEHLIRIGVGAVAVANAPAVPKSTGKPKALRSADVVKAVKAVERAGLEVTATEIRHDGSIKFTHSPAAPDPGSAYDKWKERRNARST